jgi:hypothetical protein
LHSSFCSCAKSQLELLPSLEVISTTCTYPTMVWRVRLLPSMVEVIRVTYMVIPHQLFWGYVHVVLMNSSDGRSYNWDFAQEQNEECNFLIWLSKQGDEKYYYSDQIFSDFCTWQLGIKKKILAYLKKKYIRYRAFGN